MRFSDFLLSLCAFALLCGCAAAFLHALDRDARLDAERIAAWRAQ